MRKLSCKIVSQIVKIFISSSYLLVYSWCWNFEVQIVLRKEAVILNLRITDLNKAIFIQRILWHFYTWKIVFINFFFLDLQFYFFLNRFLLLFAFNLLNTFLILSLILIVIMISLLRWYVDRLLIDLLWRHFVNRLGLAPTLRIIHLVLFNSSDEFIKRP